MVTWVSGVAVGVGGVADVDLVVGGVAKQTPRPPISFLRKVEVQCQLASVQDSY